MNFVKMNGSGCNSGSFVTDREKVHSRFPEDIGVDPES